MLKYYKIESGRLSVAPNEEAADIVMMGSLSQEQRSILVKEYEITEHTIASAFDSDELSRIEYDDDFTTIVFKKPKNYSAEDNFQFRVESFGIFIFKENTFVLRVLSFAIAHFNEHLKIINRINDDLELRLNTSMENKYLLSMFSLNKGLIYYVSALNSNDTLLRKLQLGRSLNWTEAERELLEDIQIENGQSLQQANIYANILTSMMDARASVINNNVNQLMKNLTIVTISISLPTFFASLFGMNVKLPFGMNGDATVGSPVAFWIIIAICFLSVFVFLAVWMRKK